MRGHGLSQKPNGGGICGSRGWTKVEEREKRNLDRKKEGGNRKKKGDEDGHKRKRSFSFWPCPLMGSIITHVMLGGGEKVGRERGELEKA